MTITDTQRTFTVLTSITGSARDTIEIAGEVLDTTAASVEQLVIYDWGGDGGGGGGSSGGRHV